MSGKRRTRRRAASVFAAEIMQSIRYIKKYIEGLNEEAFYEDVEKQDSVIRRLELIGEAARNITGEEDRDERGNPLPLAPETQAFRESHPELWKNLIFAGRMRNLLIHEYFRVDAGVVWRTTQNSILVLENLLSALPPEEFDAALPVTPPGA